MHLSRPPRYNKSGFAESHNTPDILNSSVTEQQVNKINFTLPQAMPEESILANEFPSLEVHTTTVAVTTDMVIPPSIKTNKLKEAYFVLPNEDDGKTRIFIDRKLPVTDVEMYYEWSDKMTSKGVSRTELAGPYSESPFINVHLSPLMTAHKRPRDRRCVFDASFGLESLNSNTLTGLYLEEPMEYSYPRIEDYRALILKAGRGCYLWKRDLSRYFLQIPLCPSEYHLVAFVWRCLLFFFTCLMFGLRNSGHQGQRLTTAVCWVHQRLGLETDDETKYNSLNYCDDFGGVEETEVRALESSEAMAILLDDLGLEESKDKYHPPSTSMPYLGVQFDSENLMMMMSVPGDKVEELRQELHLWARKKKATKKTLQQLLGKLFWVSKCVKFSRTFMCRLLLQLRAMNQYPDNKKVICLRTASWIFSGGTGT